MKVGGGKTVDGLGAGMQPAQFVRRHLGAVYQWTPTMRRKAFVLKA